jgi:hypothetical protein
MSAWWIAVVAGTTVSPLVGKWLVLRFFRHVYDKGGAEDLAVAADALRRVRTWQITRELAAKRVRRLADPGSRSRRVS